MSNDAQSLVNGTTPTNQVNTEKTINTGKIVIPKIYAYTLPNDTTMNGWIKIGYTRQESVETRIKQQFGTSAVDFIIEMDEIARYSDGKTYFVDHDFHRYLTNKRKVVRMAPKPGKKKPPEWFRLSPDDTKKYFKEFCENKGLRKDGDGVAEYFLRDEQEDAVSRTHAYFKSNKGKEYLWNAKPRFGKTLATYDLCKRIKADKGDEECNILIVTNRPVIANSWYDDYAEYIGRESGFYFVSDASAFKVTQENRSAYSQLDSREDFQKRKKNDVGANLSRIEFVSLQDLKGSSYFGGTGDKLKEISTAEWDLLVVDEAHEGVDTDKTDEAFKYIKRKYTLHLSGTPFKALANEKFPNEAIFPWTYVDEQRAKNEWDDNENENPYEDLPRLTLFTYRMSDIVRDKLKQGVEVEGNNEKFEFDLNEFFATYPPKDQNDQPKEYYEDDEKKTKIQRFKNEDSVKKFLDALTTQPKYPFSTDKLRNELRHTIWILDRVASAKALAKLLKKHSVFKDYTVIVAAGDGKLDKPSEEDARTALDKVRKAIENNPNGKTVTLSVGQLTTGITVPEWTGVLMLCNWQSPEKYMQAAFRAQTPWHYVETVKTDKNMVEQKYHMKQNAYVFDFNPARTLKLYEDFANNLSQSASDGKSKGDTRQENIGELRNYFPVIAEDKDGEMIELNSEEILTIPRENLTMKVVSDNFSSVNLFRNYSDIPPEIRNVIWRIPDSKAKNKGNEPVLSIEIGDRIRKELFGDKKYVTKSDLEAKRDAIREFLKNKFGFKNIDDDAIDNFILSLNPPSPDDVATDEDNADVTTGTSAATGDITESEEEKDDDDNGDSDDENKENRSDEANVQKQIIDRLKGFSSKIPALLMAYGDENTTLENLDTVVPKDEFVEVTGITVDMFKRLRDEGQLFDSIVVNASIKEFSALRDKLSNYLDGTLTENIFKYVPNINGDWVFTPKDVVTKMVNELEETNPGCFDDSNRTFIDIYMKSGLYIAEIVKRLYNSDKIKKEFPDDTERLRHIFEKQVYGLAPSILYKISLNYILSVDVNNVITKHNFRQSDAFRYAEEGALEEHLKELFRE